MKVVGPFVLADLHGEMVGENQVRIVQKAIDTPPDFIVYLGT